MLEVAPHLQGQIGDLKKRSDTVRAHACVIDGSGTHIDSQIQSLKVVESALHDVEDLAHSQGGQERKLMCLPE